MTEAAFEVPALEGALAPTGDAAADALVSTDPLALVIGMLLDQQISIAWAFAGPLKLRDRLAELNVSFDAGAIAALGEESLVEIFRTRPALHRYPAVMARRTLALCEYLDAEVGDPSLLWLRPLPNGSPGNEHRTARQIWTSVSSLPGFGEEKSKIFLAVLAKRFGMKPRGWKRLAEPFGDELPRTVADMGDAEGRAAVKAWKKAQKDAGRTKAD